MGVLERTLYLPARSRFGEGRAAPQKVTLRFSIKYRKEPHYKVSEAHAPADFINVKVWLKLSIGKELGRKLPSGHIGSDPIPFCNRQEQIGGILGIVIDRHP